METQGKNFIEQIIDRDLEEGRAEEVMTRFRRNTTASSTCVSMTRTRPRKRVNLSNPSRMTLNGSARIMRTAFSSPPIILMRCMKLP